MLQVQDNVDKSIQTSSTVDTFKLFTFQFCFDAFITGSTNKILRELFFLFCYIIFFFLSSESFYSLRNNNLSKYVLSLSDNVENVVVID